MDLGTKLQEMEVCCEAIGCNARKSTRQDPKEMYRCKCGTRWYCSQGCELKHWKVHRFDCSASDIFSPRWNPVLQNPSFTSETTSGEKAKERAEILEKALRVASTPLLKSEFASKAPKLTRIQDLTQALLSLYNIPWEEKTRRELQLQMGLERLRLRRLLPGFRLCALLDAIALSRIFPGATSVWRELGDMFLEMDLRLRARTSYILGKETVKRPINETYTWALEQVVEAEKAEKADKAENATEEGDVKAEMGTSEMRFGVSRAAGEAWLSAGEGAARCAAKLLQLQKSSALTKIVVRLSEEAEAKTKSKAQVQAQAQSPPSSAALPASIHEAILREEEARASLPDHRFCIPRFSPESVRALSATRLAQEAREDANITGKWPWRVVANKERGVHLIAIREIQKGDVVLHECPRWAASWLLSQDFCSRCLGRPKVLAPLPIPMPLLFPRLQLPMAQHERRDEKQAKLEKIDKIDKIEIGPRKPLVPCENKTEGCTEVYCSPECRARDWEEGGHRFVCGLDWSKHKMQIEKKAVSNGGKIWMLLYKAAAATLAHPTFPSRTWEQMRFVTQRKAWKTLGERKHKRNKKEAKRKAKAKAQSRNKPKTKIEKEKQTQPKTREELFPQPFIRNWNRFLDNYAPFAFNPYFDGEWFLRLSHELILGASSVATDSSGEKRTKDKETGDERTGSAIAYGRGDVLFNHSCEPNCLRSYMMCGSWVLADRDIAPGEELTIAYVDECEPYLTRKRLLRAIYDVDCSCRKCQEGA